YSICLRGNGSGNVALLARCCCVCCVCAPDNTKRTRYDTIRPTTVRFVRVLDMDMTRKRSFTRKVLHPQTPISSSLEYCYKTFPRPPRKTDNHTRVIIVVVVLACAFDLTTVLFHRAHTKSHRGGDKANIAPTSLTHMQGRKSKQTLRGKYTARMQQPTIKPESKSDLTTPGLLPALKNYQEHETEKNTQLFPTSTAAP
ncbi:unnamed protein product, partial [Ectocarpus fasciculatus]